MEGRRGGREWHKEGRVMWSGRSQRLHEGQVIIDGVRQIVYKGELVA